MCAARKLYQNMQTYMVSVDIHSQVITLAQMIDVLGKPDKIGSFERGKIYTKPRHWVNKTAVWRVWSKNSKQKPVNTHLKPLFHRTAKSLKLARKAFGNKIKIALNIGILFDSQTARAMTVMDGPLLREFTTLVDCIEISAYPCSKSNRKHFAIQKPQHKVVASHF